MPLLPIAMTWYVVLAGTIVLFYLYQCQLLRKPGTPDTSPMTIPLCEPLQQPSLYPGDSSFVGRLRQFSCVFPSYWNRGLVPGQVIHGYQIKKRLGQGSFAQVYLAEQVTTGQCVTLKWFGRWEAPWQHERNILSIVSHPVLPRLRAAFHLGLLGYFLVLDYLPGVDLAHYLDERGCLPVEKALALGNQIAQALAYLHGLPRPVLHRDIKPENVLLMQDGQASLLDMGIAQCAGHPHPFMDWGTPAYVAPEVLEHRPCPASDVFSLGILLCEVISGACPLPSAGVFPSLPTKVPGIPAFLRQMTAPTATLRPTSGTTQAALTWLRILAEGEAAR